MALEIGADVGEREVVGRVVGDLPDQHGTGGVSHHLAAQVGPHALRARLEPDAPALLVCLTCRGAHFVPLTWRGAARGTQVGPSPAIADTVTSLPAD